jgi:hypothetical protein
MRSVIGNGEVGRAGSGPTLLPASLPPSLSEVQAYWLFRVLSHEIVSEQRGFFLETTSVIFPHFTNEETEAQGS